MTDTDKIKALRTELWHVVTLLRYSVENDETLRAKSARKLQRISDRAVTILSKTA